MWTIDQMDLVLDHYMWLSIENGVNIIYGSIPTLGLLYEWIAKGKPFNPKSDENASAHRSQPRAILQRFKRERD